MLDREFDAFATHPERPLLPRRAARGDRRDQRVRLRERQRRRLPHRLRAHAGRLRALVRPALRRARRARRAPRDAPLPARRRRSRRPTGGSSRRSCASTRCTSATSSATCAASSTTRSSRATCATSTSTRASPRPSTWITSSGTTTARTPRSTRCGSCPSARRSTCTAPHGASEHARTRRALLRVAARAATAVTSIERSGTIELREHRHARRVRLGERLREGVVEGLEVAAVGQVRRHVHDIGGRAAGRLERRHEVRERAPRLTREVVGDDLAALVGRDDARRRARSRRKRRPGSTGCRARRRAGSRGSRNASWR